MLRFKLIVLTVVSIFAGNVGAAELTKFSVKDSGGSNDVFTVGDAGSVIIGNTNTLYLSKVNLFGSLKMTSPNSYPYGINIDVNYLTPWAREFSYTFNGAGKMLSLGALGNADKLTYGYIGGDSAAGLTVHDKPWIVFMPTGRVGIGNTNPQAQLEITGGVRLNTGATKAACSVDLRGTIWFTAGAVGVADTLEVCAKDAAGNYAWRPLF